MTLNHQVDYIDYLYTCNRCRSCTVDKSPQMRPLCPAYDHFGFFTYSGGGKAYVCQGILEEKVKADADTLSVAMNCLLCGACASMCPPGFDTLSFIRDLRDYLVKNGQYYNEAHRQLVEKGRAGSVWEGNGLSDDIPVFDGSQEVLLYLGDRERAEGEIIQSIKRIFEKAQVTWGILEDELPSGAVLEDLGDMDGFKEQAEKNIEYLNSLAPERMVVVCPHDAAAMINDYFNVGDLEIDVITLPMFIAELIQEEKIQLSKNDPLKITFHDPCRLSRFLEEEEPAREILSAINGIDLIEMERRGEGSWCCGSGAWAGLIVPELSAATAEKRIAEAEKTGAGTIVTACSYCKDSLTKSANGKLSVIHIAALVSDRI